MAIPALDDLGFAGFVAQDSLSLVDFGAPWCAPCKRMDPVVEQLALEFPHVRFARVDCDRSPATAASQGVMGMPTFILYRKGERVGQHVGAAPKATLAQVLRAAGA